jgi:tetratricopeptide (TPR) repeat protein
MHQPGHHLAVVFADLQSHSESWTNVPRDRMVATIGEYRYLAESLASQFGCLYREWAGDGHMFLFAQPDAAAQFGLRLGEGWRETNARLAESREAPLLPLRVGCHFGECMRMDGGEGWIGRANVVAKRVESCAEPGAFYVTSAVLDLIDLPLYRFSEAGTHELKGDALGRRTLYRLEQFDEAALERKPVEALGPEEWFLRGVALVGTEREWSEEEAECYRQAIELRPDYAEARVNLAVLLRARGDAAGAGLHYREALRARPDHPEAHYNYAILLADRGSTGPALGHLEQALRLRPDYGDAHHAYATLLAARSDERAAAHYEEALRLRPEDATAHVDYAVLLDRLGDLDAATAHYQDALRIRPDPAAHYNYALSLESRGEPTLAELHYREALRLWPGYGEAHNNLAIMLQQRGEPAEAEEHYRAALEARPEDPEAHYNYALLLRSAGRAEDAALHFRTAHELAPEVATFQSALERTD